VNIHLTGVYVLLKITKKMLSLEKWENLNTG
jgi:hypothetical protein